MDFFDFINNGDLLGRDLDSYLYHPEYLIYFVLSAVAAFALAFYLKKKDRAAVHRWLVGLWLGMLLLDVTKWGICYAEMIVKGEALEFAIDLPLHTCSTIWYTAPIALFARRQGVRRSVCAFLCTINLFGGAIGMYMGTAMMHCYSLFSYFGGQMMLYHTLVMLIPLVMLVSGYYRPEGRDYLRAFFVFLCIATPTYLLNAIFGGDYMYVYDGLSLPPFLFIAENVPHRLVWTAIALAGYFLIAVIFHYLPIGIRALSARVKAAKKSEN